MSGIRCLSCRAETSNGLALCELCRRLAESILEMLPIYFRNLSRQRRPGRPNGSLGTSATWLIRHGETEGSKVAVVLERVANDLDTWARALADDRGVDLAAGDTEAETVVALCLFLEVHLTSIATLEWAGQFLREMARHEKTLRELTESVVPGWYAGTCRHVTGRDMEGNSYDCGTETFVVPGLTWVTCHGCGTTTHARDHLGNVIDEASDWLARPRVLAETLVALMDAEPSVPRLYDRIRKWESLGWLESTRKLDDEGDPIGPKLYRLGDVFELASGARNAPTTQRMTTA